MNLHDLVAAALDEDLAPLGDLTASLLPPKRSQAATALAMRSGPTWRGFS